MAEPGAADGEHGHEFGREEIFEEESEEWIEGRKEADCGDGREGNRVGGRMPDVEGEWREEEAFALGEERGFGRAESGGEEGRERVGEDI
jgi:hypothetical protein